MQKKKKIEIEIDEEEEEGWTDGSVGKGSAAKADSLVHSEEPTWWSSNLHRYPNMYAPTHAEI